MNEFEEHTWSSAQRALDGQIAAEFEGLEGSRSLADAAGITLQAWQTDNAEHAARVSVMVAGIEHEARREHWREELARIGALVLEVPSAAPAEIVAESPVVEPEPEAVAPAGEPTPEPRSRRPRGG